MIPGQYQIWYIMTYNDQISSNHIIKYHQYTSIYPIIYINIIKYDISWWSPSPLLPRWWSSKTSCGPMRRWPCWKRPASRRSGALLWADKTLGGLEKLGFFLGKVGKTVIFPRENGNIRERGGKIMENLGKSRKMEKTCRKWCVYPILNGDLNSEQSGDMTCMMRMMETDLFIDDPFCL